MHALVLFLFFFFHELLESIAWYGFRELWVSFPLLHITDGNRIYSLRAGETTDGEKDQRDACSYNSDFICFLEKKMCVNHIDTRNVPVDIGATILTCGRSQTFILSVSGCLGMLTHHSHSALFTGKHVHIIMQNMFDMLKYQTIATL